jgi:hypothetical protein
MFMYVYILYGRFCVTCELMSVDGAVQITNAGYVCCYARIHVVLLVITLGLIMRCFVNIVD